MRYSDLHFSLFGAFEAEQIGNQHVGDGDLAVGRLGTFDRDLRAAFRTTVEYVGSPDPMSA